MSKEINQTIELPTSAAKAFGAWLDSKTHGKMIDGTAKIDPRVGGEFTVWDGGVTGKTIQIDTSKLTVSQEWRYNYDDWPEEQPSTLTIKFTPIDQDRCLLEFRQINVPEKYVDDISRGWQEYYWKPMIKFFST